MKFSLDWLVIPAEITGDLGSHRIKYTFIFLIILLGYGCGENKTPKEESLVSSSPLPVSRVEVVAEVVKGDQFVKQINSNGKIRAKRKIDMYFKTNDYLISIKVENGQSVKKGEVIAELDTTILYNNLIKARIDLEKSKNKLKEEVINYNNGMPSDSTLNPEVLKTLQIRSGIFEAENALENALLQLSYSSLKAPISGIIANLEKREGSLITSGDIFCTIIDPSSLEASFTVLENELGYIKRGLEVEIGTFANPNKKITAYISEINPLVDENGLIQIRAKINKGASKLFDGMNIKVVINQPIDKVIVIPKEALVTRSGKEVVFTLEKGLAKWNYVDIFDENISGYAIQTGLNIGDTIIVSGNMNLAHDTEVDAKMAFHNQSSN